jgi:hypothetical protein
MIASGMKVTIIDREYAVRDRIQQRLASVAGLRCSKHGTGIAAVTIHASSNGWFESNFTGCCERLTAAAAAIVKERC